MSTQLARGPRPTAGQPLSSTRQQLDELDALLQRMLDLPVQAGDEEPAAENRIPEPPRRETPPARPAPTPQPARKEVARETPAPAPKIEAPRSEPPAPPSPPAPAPAPAPRRPRTVAEPPVRGAEPRSYPASYMVVESNMPPSIPRREQAMHDDPPADAGLGPRMVREESPAGRGARQADPPIELPVPGGRHDLEADEPVDPAEELARLQSELSSPPEQWVPFRSTWQPSEQTWKPLVESWQQARKTPERPASATSLSEPPQQPPMPAERTAPPPEARPKLRDLPRFTMPPAPRMEDGPPAADNRAPSSSAPPPGTKPEPPPPGPSSSLAALPLVWFNAAFDAVLTPFGPPGQWLKGKGGRGFLGLVGLACLAGAAALAVADGIGWTW